MILLCFTQLVRVDFCLIMLVSSLLVSVIVVAMVAYVYVGGDFRIGARSCWGMGLFVLELSFINIVCQKSLSTPLTDQDSRFVFVTYTIIKNITCSEM